MNNKMRNEEYRLRAGSISTSGIFVKLLLAIICFIYLFNPRFFPTDLRKIIDIGCIVALIVGGLLKPIKISNSHFKTFNVLLAFLAYLIIGTLFHILLDINNIGVYINNAYEIISVFIRCFIVSSFFIKTIRKLNYSWKDMIDVFILSGCLELISVILAFVFPAIKLYFNGLTVVNSESAKIAFSTQYNPYRSYGLAENLFDSFGYIIALIILLTFIEGLYRKNAKIVILSGIMLIMPLLNARTGMVLALVGLLISFLKYTKKSAIQSIKIIFLIIVVLIVGVFFFSYIPETTQEWILEGSSSIMDLLFEHKSSGVFSILSNQVLFPQDFLFGEFGSPEMLGLGHSDIGYIQCVWRYGIFGSILLFWGFIKLLTNRTTSSQNERMQTFSVCVVFMLFIYLFKMFPFTNLGATFILFSCVLGADLRNEIESY